MYIQTEMSVAPGRVGIPPGVVCDDLLIANGLRFRIYKYCLMAKGLQARIYKSEWVAAGALCGGGVGGRREPVRREEVCAHIPIV